MEQLSKGLKRKLKKHEDKARLLEGNPMIVGMDLAREKHAVWVTDRSRRPVERFTVEHSSEGMDRLINSIQNLKEEHGYDRPVFFMEPTANFWKNVTNSLEEEGYLYRLIPGLATARHREIDSASFAKSDYRDAEMISHLGINLNFSSRQLDRGDRWSMLSYLASEYQDLTELASSEKHRIRAFIDLVLPEYLPAIGKRFYDLPTSLSILMAACDALWSGRIPSEEEFILQVRTYFPGQKLQKKRVRMIHALLIKGTSYGVKRLDRPAAWRIRGAVERLLHLQDQLRRTQQALLEEYRQLPYAKLLATIRGIGETQSALLLAFMGDPSQYDDSSCIVKLAGTEPGQNESGDFQGRTPITHRGRGRLRLAATRITYTLLLQNVEFQEYLVRMMSREKEPLKFMEAFLACTNKLLRVVYQMCRKMEPYRRELVRPEGAPELKGIFRVATGIQAQRERVTLQEKILAVKKMLRADPGEETP